MRWFGSIDHAFQSSSDHDIFNRFLIDMALDCVRSRPSRAAFCGSSVAALLCLLLLSNLESLIRLAHLVLVNSSLSETAFAWVNGTRRQALCQGIYV